MLGAAGQKGLFAAAQKGLALFCLFAVFPSHALKIRFPDEELSQESVLPYFKSPQMILDRRVTLKYRTELGVSLNYALDEPYYYPLYISGLLAFYFSENHGVSLSGTYFPPNYGIYGPKMRDLPAGKKLNSETGNWESGKPRTFDVLKAPYPLMMGFLNYQYTPYYGKIGLTKRFVMNLSIYGFGGPGLMVFNDNGRAFALNMGFGQRLYLTKWMAIRGDIIFYSYYGPAPAKIDQLIVDKGETVQPISSKELRSEHKRVIFNVMANLGFIFLI